MDTEITYIWEGKLFYHIRFGRKNYTETTYIWEGKLFYHIRFGRENYTEITYIWEGKLFYHIRFGRKNYTEITQIWNVLEGKIIQKLYTFGKENYVAKLSLFQIELV